MGSFLKTDLFLSVIETHKGIIYKVANSYCKDTENKKTLYKKLFYNYGNHSIATTTSLSIQHGFTELL